MDIRYRDRDSSRRNRNYVRNADIVPEGFSPSTIRCHMCDAVWKKKVLRTAYCPHEKMYLATQLHQGLSKFLEEHLNPHKN